MQNDGIEDFEFLYGQWLVQNRRRRQRLNGCDDWDDFDSVQKCWPLLDGLGNVDEYVCDDCGALGASLRIFDAQSRRWTLHWLSSSDGALQPPVQGLFRDGVGEFYGETRLDGKRVLVRYVWNKTDPESPRWEQAFSDDDGATWETYWIMDFTRLNWPFEAGLVPDQAWEYARR